MKPLDKRILNFCTNLYTKNLRSYQLTDSLAVAAVFFVSSWKVASVLRHQSSQVQLNGLDITGGKQKTQMLHPIHQHFGARSLPSEAPNRFVVRRKDILPIQT